MIRQLVSATVLCLLSVVAVGDERALLYEGFDLKLEQVTDAMTDEKACVLFVNSGPIYFSVEGKSKATIFPNNEEIHFAPDEKHLIRIGTATPVALTFVPKRNALSVENDTDVIYALATQQSLKVRFVDWPSRDTQDVTVKAPAFAYVWGIASKQCGWPALSVPAELPAPELSVFESKDHEGYAVVSIVGNKDLKLNKGFTKYGGGCQIGLGVKEILGMQGGRWTTGTVDLIGSARLVIRDQTGATVFETKFPDRYETGGGNKTLWARGQEAARAMWNAAPMGTVSITGVSHSEENVPLFGFRELWKWGVERCAFAKFD